MTCSHSTKPDRSAATCSMCLALEPQRVTLDGARILVDGADSGRVLDHEKVITARRRAKK